MQTLRADLRDSRTGPGVSVLRGGMPYRHAEVTSDGGLLYLRMWTADVPPGSHVYTVPSSAHHRILTDRRRNPRS